MNHPIVTEHVLFAKVEKALGNIRPYLEADGGNVRIVNISADNVLQLELTGACSSCSMSAMTFKAGIEDTVRREVPEINRIEAIV